MITKIITAYDVAGTPAFRSNKEVNEGYDTLRWADLLYALEFYHSNKNGIVVQCPTWKDIPYIKRTVMAHLGEPDKILGNDLYYRENGTTHYKHVSIRAVLHEPICNLVGYNTEELFYVGWTSEQDIIEMVKNDVMVVRYPEVLSIWKSIGMDAFTAYIKLTNMGYLEQEAQDFVSMCY